MTVRLSTERVIHAPPLAVFGLALDSERFPSLFTGFGPIPAIRRITVHAAPAVGSTRELENSDGSRLLERITALEAPQRHAYTLSGMQAPFGWLVRSGHAEWTFTPTAEGTRVAWEYRFELTGALAWPIAWTLLRCCMRPAMRRCLAAMAQHLESHPAQDGTH